MYKLCLALAMASFICVNATAGSSHLNTHPEMPFGPATRAVPVAAETRSDSGQFQIPADDVIEYAFCDEASPVSRPMNHPTSKARIAFYQERVISLVLKLHASHIGAHGSDDTNDPVRVNAVLHRALEQTARLYPGNPFATAGAQASLRIHHEMSGGAVVISLGREVLEDDAMLLLDTLKRDPEVDYAEFDRTAHQFSEATRTNDQVFDLQWNLHAPDTGINAPAAWHIQAVSPAVITAVIDSGYYPHPDLDGNRISSGLTMLASQGRVNGDAVDLSGFGHGTSVASVLSAVTNNNLGIAGAAWNAKFIPINVADHDGVIASSDLADAIRWAAGVRVPGTPLNPHPAKVINLSLGLRERKPCSEIFQTAINDAIANGASVVAAAGNENIPASWVAPGNCKDVITVAGTNEQGQRYTWPGNRGSNYGRAVTISAPGRDIYTVQTKIIDGREQYYGVQQTGTSFAAPHVSGVIALMLSANPDLTPAQVKQILQDTAKKPRLGNNEQVCTRPEGAGIVDAAAAVLAAKARL